MFTNKNNANIVISTLLIIFIILSFYTSLHCEENFSTLIKEKLDTIYQKFSNSVIPIQKGLAIAIDKDYALVPATCIEESKSISATFSDLKLNLAVIKLSGDFVPVNFETPFHKNEVFFLLTVLEEPSVLLVKGEFKDSKIEIQGRQILGSLLLSFDLKPLGLVVKSGSVSEALLIKPLYPEIYKLIKRKPGWLGIQVQTSPAEFDKALSISEGVVITNIYKGGPSDKAGLEKGDVIVQANGINIKELKDLQNLISTKFAGDSINLKISRNRFQKDFSVILEEPPERIQRKAPHISQIKGADITEIPESIKANLRKSIKGVFVKKLNEDSPAIGILKEGDIIVEINKKLVTNLKELNDILSKSGQSDLLILVYRQDSFQYVIIPKQKSR